MRVMQSMWNFTWKKENLTSVEHAECHSAQKNYTKEPSLLLSDFMFYELWKLFTKKKNRWNSIVFWLQSPYPMCILGVSPKLETWTWTRSTMFGRLAYSYRRNSTISSILNTIHRTLEQCILKIHPTHTKWTRTAQLKSSNVINLPDPRNTPRMRHTNGLFT